jgi:hypothetical protein
MTDTATNPALLLGQLVELLADELAPRLADLLAERQPASADDRPSRRLLTLDELVNLLPAGKSAATWKAWLYARTRRGLVPGCCKIGGRLFFDGQQTLSWLFPGESGAVPAGLDLSGNESLHAQAMPHEPTRGDRPGGGS